MTKALYVSYTGILEPLGEGQVLQYVLGLAKHHSMTILTFEKEESLQDSARIDAIERKCEAAGVKWHRRVWSKNTGIRTKMMDIIAGIKIATRLVKANDIKLVHARSYTGTLIGLGAKYRTGAKLIFDMRGFWPDERVESGIWSKSDLPYRVFKRLERTLFKSADYVVSLTRAGVREFEKFDYLEGNPPPSSVIPTCTNLDTFRVVERPREGFTLGYVGSVGGWYLFEEVAEAVRQLFEMRPDARFIALNKGGHDTIRNALVAADVDMARVDILEVPYSEVAQHIARIDAGIFFIRPVWSKRASCPTRMGELLACGKPCLANAGVGDVEEDLLETQTGIALPATSNDRVDISDLKASLEQLIELSFKPDISARCRKAAEDRFSLQGGIDEYHRIYTELTDGNANA